MKTAAPVKPGPGFEPLEIDGDRAVYSSDEEFDGAIPGALKVINSPGHEEEGCSTPRAFVNTFLSFVGAGILGLPFAFSQVGIFGAGVVQYRRCWRPWWRVLPGRLK